MTHRVVWTGLVAAGLVISACAGAAGLPSEITGSVTVESSPPTTAAPACTADQAAADPVRSYPPLDSLPSPGAMPAGSTMAAIAERGRLVVGVSADTLLFGARNPLTGEIEGFDIDVLGEVARAIFGDDGAERIEYRVITYAQRLPSLEARDVDIVAHTMTINCARWLRIAFSSEYFDAGQKILVGTGSGYSGVDDLVAAGARVCAPEGSTNIEEITKPQYVDPGDGRPGVEVIGKPDISDCLVAMQQGEADATTGDDTVLAGFAAQDPNTEVVGEAFTREPYGLGMNSADVDFVRFVNAVLEDVRSSGRWAEIYQRWLIDTGALVAAAPPDPPPADHGRELP